MKFEVFYLFFGLLRRFAPRNDVARNDDIILARRALRVGL